MTSHNLIILDYDRDVTHDSNDGWSNSQEPSTPPKQKQNADMDLSRNPSPERNLSIEYGFQSLRLSELKAQDTQLHVDQVKDVVPFWRDAMMAAEHGETPKMEPFLDKLEREYEERQKNNAWDSDQSWGKDWGDPNMWHVQTDDAGSGWGNAYVTEGGDPSYPWVSSGFQGLDEPQHSHVRASRGRYRSNHRRPLLGHNPPPRHSSPSGSRLRPTNAQEEIRIQRGRSVSMDVILVLSSIENKQSARINQGEIEVERAALEDQPEDQKNRSSSLLSPLFHISSSRIQVDGCPHY
jgi:hypothetical protein